MDIQANNKPLTLEVRDLDCPDCARSLEQAVQQLPGVATAQLDFTASKLILTLNEGAQPVGAIQKLAESMGHRVLAPEAADPPQPAAPLSWRERLWRRRHDLSTWLGGVLLLAGFWAGLLGASEAATRVLYGASIVIGGIYVALAGWQALWRGRNLDMNVLMTIAAIGAMVVGEFAEGAVTIFLFSIGELLEGYSSDRARRAIRALMKLAPAEATLLRNGAETRTPISSLRIGDRILVRPGERLPMDGRVSEGRSVIDQSPITGESVPVEKALGDEVFAGTINGNGALTVEVTRLAEDNTIARIMHLVEEAQSQRAPAQRFVDRFARVYTPTMIGLATLVAFLPPLLGLGALSVWGYRALVLLVIACPCALVISTPVTIVSSLARAARAGVLIKGGRYLEELAAVRVVAFDKTGTLTHGKPEVVAGGCSLHPTSTPDCANCQDLLAKAASIESRSEHALARAVTAHAERNGVNGRYAAGEQVRAITGLGIEGVVEGHNITVGSLAFCQRRNGLSDPLCTAAVAAEAKGYTVLVVDDMCCGSSCYFAVSDTLREGAAEAIQELRNVGVEHFALLTGDNAHTAQAIADQVGVDHVLAGLLPEGKVQSVNDLLARYGRVAMVGDGVNDAPALAAATVGIAMGAAGTDAALETADIALMGDDLAKLPFAIRLSRAALGTVRVNIAFSLGIKALFLILAVAGFSTLWMAVLADVGLSMLVTLNGMRMLRYR